MYCDCNMHKIYAIAVFSPLLSSTASSIASFKFGSSCSLPSSPFSACGLGPPLSSASPSLPPAPCNAFPPPLLAGRERLQRHQLHRFLLLPTCEARR